MWYLDGTTMSADTSPGLAQLMPTSHGTADDKFQVPKKPATTEVKLKNAGSWSSLASMASSQTSGTSTVKKSTTAMSFELFKKAAKEKEERERVSREQAELRRRKLELEQAERTKAERERQRAREEEEALDSALKAQQRDTGSQPSQPLTESQLMAQKERERQREQQRRRLAARANQIDMTAQSELMASFEENL